MFLIPFPKQMAVQDLMLFEQMSVCQMLSEQMLLEQKSSRHFR
jgi:hypothetical protein